MFRDYRGRFESGPACAIAAELVAGLHPPEFKTKVATALDMKGSWKEHSDLVYSVAREAAGACATVEQADKLRRVQSRENGAVARVGSAKEENPVGVGRGGKGSSARSDYSKPRGSCWNWGEEGHRMADCATKGPCSAWRCNLRAAVLFPAKF